MLKTESYVCFGNVVLVTCFWVWVTEIEDFMMTLVVFPLHGDSEAYC
jgi:hypothetical protein